MATQTPATDFTGAYPSGLPAQYQQELEALSQANKLSGLPPQILAYIMQAESGPSYEGGGWNGKAGGWFGLEPGDGGITQAEITSQTTFDQQAQIAASIYATGLSKAAGNPIEAENYYQTGVLTTAANGAKIFEQYGLQDLVGALSSTGAGAAGSVVPASPTPLGPLGSGVNVGGNVSLGWATDLDNLLQDIAGGFGIGWKAVLSIIGGIMLVGVGLMILLRHQEASAATALAA